MNAPKVPTERARPPTPKLLENRKDYSAENFQARIDYCNFRLSHPTRRPRPIEERGIRTYRRHCETVLSTYEPPDTSRRLRSDKTHRAKMNKRENLIREMEEIEYLIYRRGGFALLKTDEEQRLQEAMIMLKRVHLYRRYGHTEIFAKEIGLVEEIPITTAIRKCVPWHYWRDVLERIMSEYHSLHTSGDWESDPAELMERCPAVLTFKRIAQGLSMGWEETLWLAQQYVSTSDLGSALEELPPTALRRTLYADIGSLAALFGPREAQAMWRVISSLILQWFGKSEDQWWALERSKIILFADAEEWW